MRKIVVMFAGQGAQYVGMGKDFYDQHPSSKQVFDDACYLLGYDIRKICFEQNEEIHQTQFTQPAILTTSLAIYQALMNSIKIKPQFVLGFSLGEYSAIYASGMISFQNIIELIQKRANYMAQDALKHPGAMAAILGMDRVALNNICNEVQSTIGLVQIANYNSPNQLVISGLKPAVEKACELAKANGAKRAMMLNVSGGFHTSLMSDAANKIEHHVQRLDIKKPTIDIIMNCDASKLKSTNELAHKMKQQLSGAVYFEDSVKEAIKQGATTFIEIGPGQVLTGLVKKIDSTVEVISIDKYQDIELVKQFLGGNINEFNK